MKQQLIIATRESELALWQSRHAAQLIEQSLACQTKLMPMTTEGDQRLEVSLNKIGGKGLFLKELEHSMLAGETDLAVHSMKDVPAQMPDDFTIAAILTRADYSDAFVSNTCESLQQLPEGAVVGTSSLRRQAQLLSLRPDLRIEPLRGNINTRLRKLDDGQYDAIVLASAGLLRLDMGARIRQRLLAPDWLPAIAQGAIGVECLYKKDGDNELAENLAVLTDVNTAICINTERTFNQKLGGSCSVAIGGYAVIEAGVIHFHGAVFSADGKKALRCKVSGKEPKTVGLQAAQELLDAGAEQILNTQT
ncbi:hydroxymethylbilane synthase [Marinicella sp. W31]|uniref:hydroxymethylbilane synthase n=1 Tax=Marinicella sp. W31 TaxID=3023713 RepID=UPI00375795EF